MRSRWPHRYFGRPTAAPGNKLGETCFKLFPTTFPLLQPAVERQIHPLLWDPFLLGFFLLPTWLVLTLFGLLFFWVARRRAAAIGYSSRP